MTGERQNERRIRVVTQYGTIEGVIRVPPLLRTLDELNMQARLFTVIKDPSTGNIDWGFGLGDLAVNKRSIQFVHELSNPPQSDRKFGGQYSRGTMRLRVGSFVIEGFLHVPPGGECLKRLNQGQHDFVALTSVSVTGPDSQFATPFLAVNRLHVLAAQALSHDVDTEDEPLEVSFEVAE